MRIFPIAGTLLVGALSVFLAGTSVLAAVILQGHYEDFAGMTCFNTNVCRVSFDPIPAGRTVIVTRVSCRAEIAASTSSTIVLKEVVLQILRPNGVELFQDHFLTPVFLGSEGNSRYYQINNDALHLYNNLRVPRIEFRLGADTAFGIVINCQIGGTIKSAAPRSRFLNVV